MSYDNHFLHLNDYTLVNLSYLMRLADQIVRDRDGLFPITRAINCAAYYKPVLTALNKLDEKHQWSYVMRSLAVDDNRTISRGFFVAQLLTDDTIIDINEDIKSEEDEGDVDADETGH